MKRRRYTPEPRREALGRHGAREPVASSHAMAPPAAADDEPSGSALAAPTQSLASALHRRQPAAPQRRRPVRLVPSSLTNEGAYVALLLAMDGAMILFALGARMEMAQISSKPPENLSFTLAYPPLVLGLLWLRGAYRSRLRIVVVDSLGRVLASTSIAAMALLALEALAGGRGAADVMVFQCWLLTTASVGAGRILLDSTERRRRVSGRASKATLIIGAGPVGGRIARRLEEEPGLGLRPIGFLDPTWHSHASDGEGRLCHPHGGRFERRGSGRRRTDGALVRLAEAPVDGRPVLGGLADLASVARLTGAEHVIIAFSSAPDHDLVSLVEESSELGLSVSLVPRLFESINDRIAMEHLGGLPLIDLRPVNPRGFGFLLKHAIDRLAAAFGLLLLAPVMIAAAVGVKLTSPGPVLFRQLRVGRDGQVFRLLKFRSMRLTDDDGADGFRPAPGLAPGGVEGIDRRTRFGGFLRDTAIDELPQLLNVLRGQMSLIGPRPERPEYVELFRRDMQRYGDRHRVKAGITGWAQVHGLRGQTSLSDRVEWDNYYIQNWSFWLDLRILLMTIQQVMRHG